MAFALPPNVQLPSAPGIAKAKPCTQRGGEVGRSFTKERREARELGVRSLAAACDELGLKPGTIARLVCDSPNEVIGKRILQGGVGVVNGEERRLGVEVALLHRLNMDLHDVAEAIVKEDNEARARLLALITTRLSEAAGLVRALATIQRSSAA